MTIKHFALFSSLGLLLGCQANPQPISTAPQPSPSATSDISTVGQATPLPTTTALPMPTPYPTPDSTPYPIAQPSPSSMPLPEPVFHPTCTSCSFQLTSVSRAAWSPDGKQLAYVLVDRSQTCTPRRIPAPGDNNDYFPIGGGCAMNDERQAFVKPFQSNSALALTEKNRVTEIRGWSPLGDRILLELFSLEANGNNQIYTVKPDGSQLNRVYPTQARQHLPTWSADGKQIAFVAPELNRNVSWIEAVNSDGSNWRQLTSMNDFPRQISWNKERVAFSEPWSENTPGAPYGSRLRTAATQADAAVFPLVGLEDKTLMDFQWSPDGQKLAYISIDYSGNKAHLMLTNGDGSMPREIQLGIRNDSGSVFSGLAWSPDNRFLAYAQTSVTDKGVKVSDLYLYDSQSQSQKPLTRAGETGLPIFYQKPVWSPDGQRLAFISNHEVKFREVYAAHDSLYTMRVDGTDIQLEVYGNYAVTKPESSTP